MDTIENVLAYVNNCVHIYNCVYVTCNSVHCKKQILVVYLQSENLLKVKILCLWVCGSSLQTSCTTNLQGKPQEHLKRIGRKNVGVYDRVYRVQVGAGSCCGYKW